MANDDVFSVCVHNAVCRIICTPQSGRQHNAVGLNHVKKHRVTSVSNISCDMVDNLDL